jgi:putative FmdB family regulatory protein
MPTYEYICKACGNAWEAEQRISAAPLKECPKCHEPQAERQISGGNFILKGGGWYADLYSSSPKKGSTGGGSPTKTETKTETKSESSTTTPSTPSTPAKKD